MRETKGMPRSATSAWLWMLRAFPCSLRGTSYTAIIRCIRFEEVAWEITEDDLAFSRVVEDWGTEFGEFRVWVGTDSRNGIEGTLQLA